MTTLCTPVSYPASSGQEAVWAADRFAGRPGAYVEACAWRLAAPVDRERLAAAVTTVAGRHEVLRTRLRDTGHGLEQVVGTVPVRLETLPPGYVDWLRRPIDPSAGPPLRVGLAADRTLLGLALHHAFVDSWSLALLLDELSRAYAGEPLEPVSQFGPWAAAEPRPGRPLLPAGTLPRRSGRAGWQTWPPDDRGGWLPPVTVAAPGLPAAVRTRRATAFELVAAAATAALRSTLGPDDAVLGAVMSSRDTEPARRMLGYCATVLPVPCPVPVTVDGIVRGVAVARALRAFPPSAVAAAGARATPPGRHPLYDAVLAYDAGPPPVPRLAGGPATPVEIAPAGGRFPLALHVRDRGEVLDVAAEWSGPHLDSDRVRGLVDALGAELAAVVRDGTRVPRAVRTAVTVPAADTATGPASGPAGAGAGPAGGWRDGMELEVVAAWTQVLGRPPDRRDVGFFAAGGDSLAAVHLCARMAERGHRGLRPAQLVEADTVPRIADLLRGTADPDVDPCLVRLRRGRGEPLVLIHPVGGTVTWYAPLVPLLGDREIWAVQAAGLTPGRDFDRTVPAMAEHYAALIEAELGSGGLCVGGYSMGGTVAAEVVRLRAEHHPPPRLLLLDTSAAGGQQGDDPHYGVRVLVERALRLRFDWESVVGLDLPEQAERILAAARREGRLPEAYDAARLTRMIEVYPVNREALLRHRPRPYAGPACLLTTAGEESRRDPALGWAPLLPRLRLRTVPGDHYSLLDPPNAPEVARVIRSWLAGELD